ncbi:MAG: UvrD-helicase domain-containing protein [Lachnospiraceae bacterium]|nr:UvrD-helicase domain-containing protein [Lachnospiraceae bacterium]
MKGTIALNPEQEDAVRHTEGPVLILAGAGSGKTRVLTERIAYLIAEKGVKPWQILAITFTNKAAKELKERVEKTVGDDAQYVLAATFHAACVRILRRHADLLGYDTHFSIYDSDDSKALMKQILKRDQLETRDLKLRTFLTKISSAKDSLISAGEYLMAHQYDRDVERIAHAYREYQRALKEANAFDFDDLIMQTVELFRRHPEVLEECQERWHYICVDEYQDTNNAQFELVRLLAGRYRNLCVVGDDDQSIYRFRGANIRNILDFELVYPDAYTVKLEQNYRSTQHILSAANGIIAHNAGRKDKALWSDLGDGERVRLRVFSTAYDEADFVAQEVAALKQRGESNYADVAVLYRTNAQSRLLEERFVREGIPYELVGGVHFYARREIKDLLAYLKTIDNARDDLAVMRIINVPKRGIGAGSIDKLAAYAARQEIPFYEALDHAPEVLGASGAKKIAAFTRLIEELRETAEEFTVGDLITELIGRIEYEDYLMTLSEVSDPFGEEENARVLNVGELISKAADYDASTEAPSLTGFLEEVALIADIDLADDTADRAMLMTLHAAKGLEFARVYLTGMEEDVFPSYQSCQAEDYDKTAMEEERRLAYVGMTRAKRHLTLCSARARMMHGETHYHRLSRFVEEIPQDLIEGGEDALQALRTTGARAGRSGDLPTGRNQTSANSAVKYMQAMKSKINQAPSMQKGMPAGTRPEYDAGDRVRHIKFGEGTVTGIEQETRDYKVSVDFDDYGPKVMYAAFAKLQKV